VPRREEKSLELKKGLQAVERKRCLPKLAPSLAWWLVPVILATRAGIAV
jgi:hypothetical protein